MKFNIAIIGFGTVGQGLAEILIKKKDDLIESQNFEFDVVAICDKLKGSIFHEDGLELPEILSTFEKTGTINKYPTGIKGWDSIKTITDTNADIIIELSYTNITTGEPATSHIRTAFKYGKHVVTSNKGPSALYHTELTKLASKHNVQYKIEGTVLSGTPVFNMAQKNLAGCSIIRIRGIVNGTTNYILSQMEAGEEYGDALQKAVNLGYAEADPTGDVEGWDATAKVVILSNVLMGTSLTINDVKRKGIIELCRHDIEQAKIDGCRWKLIGNIEKMNDAIEANVLPQKLPVDDPLANVMGNTNAITFETDLLGPITIIGAGAGKQETGFAILSDLLDINSYYSN